MTGCPSRLRKALGLWLEACVRVAQLVGHRTGYRTSFLPNPFRCCHLCSLNTEAERNTTSSLIANDSFFLFFHLFRGAGVSCLFSRESSRKYYQFGSVASSTSTVHFRKLSITVQTGFYETVRLRAGKKGPTVNESLCPLLYGYQTHIPSRDVTHCFYS